MKRGQFDIKKVEWCSRLRRRLQLSMLRLLMVKLGDLDDRRRGTERRPAPTGRGSHQLDLTPSTRERGKKKKSQQRKKHSTSDSD